MLQQKYLPQHRQTTFSASLISGVHRLYRSRSAITSLTGKVTLNNSTKGSNNTINNANNSNTTSKSTTPTSMKQAQPYSARGKELDISAKKNINYKFNISDNNNTKRSINNARVDGSARLRRLASSSSSLAFTQHQ